jgi:hypothetical protein
VNTDVGPTNNYGAFSPANGSALSSADEDHIPNDCFLWHQLGSDKSTWNQDLSYPYPTQGQAHLVGLGTNPLEVQVGGISWDVRVVVASSNLDNIRAYANVTHSCFPGMLSRSRTKSYTGTTLLGPIQIIYLAASRCSKTRSKGT